jgi:hypothetical protein
MNAGRTPARFFPPQIDFSDNAYFPGVYPGLVEFLKFQY